MEEEKQINERGEVVDVELVKRLIHLLYSEYEDGYGYAEWFEEIDKNLIQTTPGKFSIRYKDGLTYFGGPKCLSGIRFVTVESYLKSLKDDGCDAGDICVMLNNNNRYMGGLVAYPIGDKAQIFLPLETD